MKIKLYQTRLMLIATILYAGSTPLLAQPAADSIPQQTLIAAPLSQESPTNAQPSKKRDASSHSSLVIRGRSGIGVARSIHDFADH